MQKLKSAIAVRRSMMHAFREQDTPNADPERKAENIHIGAKSSEEAMDRFNDALPDKVRKNAVLAVEYLITASPEAMHDKSKADQNAYFKDALLWLKNKHGAKNLVYAGIHHDETTPHMYAYVVPNDELGKLNCRSFYGERSALSKMQTDFADKVGREHGLERGLEGSRARHTNIKQYYGRVRDSTPITPSIDVPETKLFEGKEAYGRRVAKAVLDQLAPEFRVLQAKAQQTDLALQQVKVAEKGMKEAELRCEHQKELVRIEKEKTKENAISMKNLAQVIARGGPHLEKLHEVFKERLDRVDSVKQQEKGRSR